MRVGEGVSWDCIWVNYGKISTEVRPLMDVGNWFSLSIFGIPIPIFFKLGMRDDIVKECSRIADR